MNKLYWDESIQLVPSMKKKKKKRKSHREIKLFVEKKGRGQQLGISSRFEEHLIKYLKLSFVYILIYIIYIIYNIYIFQVW